MRAWDRGVGAAGAVVLGAIAALVSVGNAHAAGFDPATAEQQLFALTNQDRTSNGLPALVPKNTLFSIARDAPQQVCGGGATLSGRSTDMIERGYFSHQIPSCNQYVWPVLNAYGLQYLGAGENIGWNNYSVDQSVGQVNTAFMNSPEHRANILGDYTSAGMGAWAAPGPWTDSNGTFSNVIMYTEEFLKDPSTPTASPPPPPPPPSTTGSAAPYQALEPARILDTRTGSGKPYAGSTLGPGATLDVQVGGVSGVPASTATAVMLNVTTSNPTAEGFLTVYPAGQPRPLASNLDFVPGQDVPNLVAVPLGSGGRVSIYNSSGSTDVIADVEGYFGSPATGLYQAVAPSRIVDTRPGSGQPYASQTLGSDTTLPVQVSGRGGVPAAGASAVVLNVTATNPSGPGFLTLFPSGSSRPLASNLDFNPGDSRANRVVVPLGSDGKVDIYNYGGSTDVIADVAGWYSSAGGSMFSPTSPLRLADTRAGSGQSYAGRTLGPGGTLNVQVAALGQVPPMSSASPPRAVVLNITATNTTAGSFITAYPADVPRPLASDLDWAPGATVPNLVVVAVSGAGSVAIYNNSGNADVVVDLLGWYS